MSDHDRLSLELGRMSSLEPLAEPPSPSRLPREPLALRARSTPLLVGLMKLVIFSLMSRRVLRRLVSS
jgi:hypothetical protein